MTLKKLHPKNVLEFFVPSEDISFGQPFIANGISAGFPSPADDFRQESISLDATLVKNKEATFYARVRGQSMTGAGLDDGDLLVIDRSLEPKDNQIAVCYLDGAFTVKRLKVSENAVFLMPENPDYPPIPVTEGQELIVWGVVTYVIKNVSS